MSAQCQAQHLRAGEVRILNIKDVRNSGGGRQGTPGISLSLAQSYTVTRVARCEIRAELAVGPPRYLVSRWYVVLLPFTSLTRMMDILDWATISLDLMCVYQSITPHILAIFTNTENSPLFSHYHFVEDNLNILEVFKTSNNGWLGRPPHRSHCSKRIFLIK